MPKIIIHQEKVTDPQALIEICTFDAIELVDGKLGINAACKLCKVCLKKGPEGVFEYIEDKIEQIDKSLWKGIAIYVDHHQGDIHPVTYELIGKAKELAAKINHPVVCVFIGNNIENKTDDLFHHGAEEVFIYDYPELNDFLIEPYAACMEDFINRYHPSTILVGGTTIGRSLAPRVAARFRTGLTADCTVLDMQKNTDLDQIRPAFGGNIMAHIRTPNSRPQFATVRYKIFNALAACDLPEEPKVNKCEIDREKLRSRIKILNVRSKEKVKSIEDADIIVVAGRGIKKVEDLEMLKNLAKALDGQFATTRPLIEAGWENPRNQIGLSGRTVKPKLIITCGVSGSIQFRAGMQNSQTIIAINTDESANIFSVAHYGLIGDLYKIVPSLTEKIKKYIQTKC
jgi:electron transfer flavoprotein alpha subunit